MKTENIRPSKLASHDHCLYDLFLFYTFKKLFVKLMFSFKLLRIYQCIQVLQMLGPKLCQHTFGRSRIHCWKKRGRGWTGESSAVTNKITNNS